MSWVVYHPISLEKQTNSSLLQHQENIYGTQTRNKKKSTDSNRNMRYTSTRWYMVTALDPELDV